MLFSSSSKVATGYGISNGVIELLFNLNWIPPNESDLYTFEITGVLAHH